ncbi:MAG: hypothetical protein HQ575_07115, partial [Candidatus Omnitrophica bacterium]|nr:hypothetical protein [Candidatus Omnitrophota bacterium]
PELLDEIERLDKEIDFKTGETLTRKKWQRLQKAALELFSIYRTLPKDLKDVTVELANNLFSEKRGEFTGSDDEVAHFEEVVRNTDDPSKNTDEILRTFGLTHAMARAVLGRYKIDESGKVLRSSREDAAVYEAVDMAVYQTEDYQLLRELYLSGKRDVISRPNFRRLVAVKVGAVDDKIYFIHHRIRHELGMRPKKSDNDIANLLKDNGIVSVNVHSPEEPEKAPMLLKINLKEPFRDRDGKQTSLYVFVRREGLEGEGWDPSSFLSEEELKYYTEESHFGELIDLALMGRFLVSGLDYAIPHQGYAKIFARQVGRDVNERKKILNILNKRLGEPPRAWIEKERLKDKIKAFILDLTLKRDMPACMAFTLYEGRPDPLDMIAIESLGYIPALSNAELARIMSDEYLDEIVVLPATKNMPPVLEARLKEAYEFRLPGGGDKEHRRSFHIYLWDKEKDLPVDDQEALQRIAGDPKAIFELIAKGEAKGGLAYVLADAPLLRDEIGDWLEGKRLDNFLKNAPLCVIPVPQLLAEELIPSLRKEPSEVAFADGQWKKFIEILRRNAEAPEIPKERVCDLYLNRDGNIVVDEAEGNSPFMAATIVRGKPLPRLDNLEVFIKGGMLLVAGGEYDKRGCLRTIIYRRHPNISTEDFRNAAETIRAAAASDNLSADETSSLIDNCLTGMRYLIEVYEFTFSDGRGNTIDFNNIAVSPESQTKKKMTEEFASSYLRRRLNDDEAERVSAAALYLLTDERTTLWYPLIEAVIQKREDEFIFPDNQFENILGVLEKHKETVEKIKALYHGYSGTVERDLLEERRLCRIASLALIDELSFEDVPKKGILQGRLRELIALSPDRPDEMIIEEITRFARDRTAIIELINKVKDLREVRSRLRRIDRDLERIAGLSLVKITADERLTGLYIDILFVRLHDLLTSLAAELERGLEQKTAELSGFASDRLSKRERKKKDDLEIRIVQVKRDLPAIREALTEINSVEFDPEELTPIRERSNQGVFIGEAGLLEFLKRSEMMTAIAPFEGLKAYPKVTEIILGQARQLGEKLAPEELSALLAAADNVCREVIRIKREASESTDINAPVLQLQETAQANGGIATGLSPLAEAGIDISHIMQILQKDLNTTITQKRKELLDVLAEVMQQRVAKLGKKYEAAEEYDDIVAALKIAESLEKELAPLLEMPGRTGLLGTVKDMKRSLEEKKGTIEAKEHARR